MSHKRFGRFGIRGTAKASRRIASSMAVFQVDYRLIWLKPLTQGKPSRIAKLSTDFFATRPLSTANLLMLSLDSSACSAGRLGNALPESLKLTM